MQGEHLEYNPLLSRMLSSSGQNKSRTNSGRESERVRPDCCDSLAHFRFRHTFLAPLERVLRNIARLELGPEEERRRQRRQIALHATAALYKLSSGRVQTEIEDLLDYQTDLDEPQRFSETEASALRIATAQSGCSLGEISQAYLVARAEAPNTRCALELTAIAAETGCPQDVDSIIDDFKAVWQRTIRGWQCDTESALMYTRLLALQSFLDDGQRIKQVMMAYLPKFQGHERLMLRIMVANSLNSRPLAHSLAGLAKLLSADQCELGDHPVPVQIAAAACCVCAETGTDLATFSECYVQAFRHFGREASGNAAATAAVYFCTDLPELLRHYDQLLSQSEFCSLAESELLLLAALQAHHIGSADRQLPAGLRAQNPFSALFELDGDLAD